MRLIWFIFGLLLLLLGLCIAAFLHPAGQVSTMTLHELNPAGTVSLLKSQTNGITPPARFWGGVVAGLTVLALMGSLILLGWQRKQGTVAHRPWLIGGMLGYALLFVGLWNSYAAYTATGKAAIIAGYPVPTAWMLYAIWLWPLLMVSVMIWRFDAWFLDPKDVERLAELVQENQAKQEHS
ncbi:MAG: hypothetical protein AAF399_16860 [Bacteroidota bacterium]